MFVDICFPMLIKLLNDFDNVELSIEINYEQNDIHSKDRAVFDVNQSHSY